MKDQKFDERYKCLINHDTLRTFFEDRRSNILGSRQNFPFFEDFCNIPKEELEKIIDEISKIGYPNLASKEELEYAIRRNNL